MTSRRASFLEGYARKTELGSQGKGYYATSPLESGSPARKTFFNAESSLSPQHVRGRSEKDDVQSFWAEGRDSILERATRDQLPKPGTVDKSLDLSGGDTHGSTRLSITALLHKKKARTYYIHPKHPRKVWWDMFVGMLIVWSAITVPYDLSFNSSTTGGDLNIGGATAVLHLVIDGVFMMDVVLNFFTAYVENDHLVKDLRKISQKYLTTWCLLDVVSSLPVDYIEPLLAGGFGILRSLKLIKTLRLFRLLKLVRVLRLSRKQENIVFTTQQLLSPSAIRLCQLMGKIVFMAHIIACIWYSMNHCRTGASYEDVNLQDEVTYDWVECGGSQPASRYLASLYFTVTTLISVGYGDITAQNDREKLFVLWLEMVGATTFGFIIAMVGLIVAKFDPQSNTKKERMDKVHGYISEHKLPSYLAMELRKHFSDHFSVCSVFNEVHMLRDLPHSVRYRAAFSTHKESIQTIRLMEHLDSVTISDLVYRLKPMFTIAGEAIMHQGGVLEDCFFVISGLVEGSIDIDAHKCVELFGERRRDPSVGCVELVTLYRDGTDMELSSLMRNRPCSFHLKALMDTRLVWIDGDDLIHLMESYPAACAAMELLADREEKLLKLALASQPIVVRGRLIKNVALLDWEIAALGDIETELTQASHHSTPHASISRFAASTVRTLRRQPRQESLHNYSENATARYATARFASSMTAVRSSFKMSPRSTGVKIPMSPRSDSGKIPIPDPNPNPSPNPSPNPNPNPKVTSFAVQTKSFAEESTSAVPKSPRSGGLTPGKKGVPLARKKNMWEILRDSIKSIFSWRGSAKVAVDNGPNTQPNTPTSAGGHQRVSTWNSTGGDQPWWRGRSTGPLQKILVEGLERPKDLAARGIILPHHPWKLTWDIIIYITIAYSAITVPYSIAFSGGGDDWGTMAKVVDSLFGIDIILTLRTAYKTVDGVFVTEPGMIARRYARTWLLLDVISTIPLSLIVHTAIDGTLGALRSVKLVKMVRIVNVLRMLRLFRVAKKGRGDQQASHRFVGNVVLVRGLSLTLIITYLAHLLGCCWGFLGNLSSQGGADTWFSSVEFSPDDHAKRYIASVYWAFTTMTTVGYGDIVPTRDRERIFVTIAMLVGGTVFGYVVGSVGALISDPNSSMARVKDRMLALTHYLDERRVSPSLALAVKLHFEYSIPRDISPEQRQLLRLMPPLLRCSVVLFTRRHVIGKQAILRSNDRLYVAYLVRQLVPCFFVQGTLIVSADEKSPGLCLLIHGVAYAVGGGANAKQYGAGRIFGYESCVNPKNGKIVPVDMGIAAKTDCALYLLSEESLINIAEQHPAAMDKLQKAVASAIIDQEQRGSLGENEAPSLYERVRTTLRRPGTTRRIHSMVSGDS